MECIENPPMPWKVSEKSERSFSVNKIRRALKFFNYVTCGNFYVVDYRENNLILGASRNSTQFGYPKELIHEEGIHFFERILPQKTKIWFEQMCKEALAVFYQEDDLDTRMEFEITYNLTAISANEQKIVLHHRLVPCDLDENGNLWRSLLHIWRLPFSQDKNMAKIINFVTGDTYDFIDGKFKQSPHKILTEEEIEILEYLIKDFSVHQICEIMHFGKTNFEQKKQNLFKKLDARNQAAAVYKALASGLIRL